MNRSRRGLPGRVFTLVFVVVLVATTVVGLAVGMRFQVMMDALADARQRWPRAAEAFANASRRQLEMTESPEAPALRASAVEAFERESRFEEQVKRFAALDIAPSVAAAQAGWAGAASDVQAYLDAEERLTQLRRDTLGQFCERLLRLKLPDPIMPPSH